MPVCFGQRSDHHSSDHHSVVIVGAGQAGLAMSHQLSGRGIDHVVLERSRVAQSWQAERWDSLRLLTPNWMSSLPGQPYDGDDPDGFMTAADTGAWLERYRQRIDAPVRSGQAVAWVGRLATGFEVVAGDDRLTCDAVVAATGAASEAHVPAWASTLPPSTTQVTSLQYRNPAQVPDGEVLVVGASASGAQIADELAAAGRSVTLAVGEHVRVPRTYRGIDIHWWLNAIGQLDEGYDEVDDIDRARRVPSLQLVGSPDRRDLDLASLSRRGVALVGKAMALDGDRILCSGALAHVVAAADLKLGRLLGRIDEWAAASGLDAGLPPAVPVEPTVLPPAPTVLDQARFGAVIWATGFRPRFPWLDPAAFDVRGRLRHDGGIGALPGLYVLGLPFLRRRRSSFISGVGPDAADLATHLQVHLDVRARA